MILYEDRFIDHDENNPDGVIILNGKAVLQTVGV